MKRSIDSARPSGALRAPAKPGLAIWFAAFAPPIAWFVDLVASWMATPPAYQHGSKLPLHVITLVSLVTTLVSLAISIVYLRRAPRWDHRASFIARCAVWMCAFSLLLVLGLAVPKLLLSAGAEP